MAFGDQVLWTAARDAVLTKKWAAGISTARIGADMQITKDTVIGRVHRLGLTPRANPVVRQNETPERAAARQEAARVRRETDARLARRRDFAAAAGGGDGKPAGAEAIGGDTLAALGVVVRGPEAAVPAPAAVVLGFPGVSRPCCWPMWGDDEKVSHLYCEAAGVPGRPYCAAHCAQAYTTSAVRSEAQIEADTARRMAGLARAARGQIRVPGERGA